MLYLMIPTQRLVETLSRTLRHDIAEMVCQNAIDQWNTHGCYNAGLLLLPGEHWALGHDRRTCTTVWYLFIL